MMDCLFTGNLPETCRKPAGNLPETCQKPKKKVFDRFPVGFRNPSLTDHTVHDVSGGNVTLFKKSEKYLQSKVFPDLHVEFFVTLIFYHSKYLYEITVIH
jgi:hypothetical protein